jgi:lysozyme
MTPKQIIKEFVKTKLNKNQTQALEQFIDNLGVDVFKNSTLLKVINRNEFDAVPKELGRWIISSGRKSDEMVKQRQKEIELFTQTP